MKATIINIVLLIMFIQPSVSLALENVLTQEEATASINKMVFSNEYNYKILKITKSINNLCAVAISPPYREFPNVILFKYENNKWNRVFEGLCLGIQPKPSGKLDLHTIKIAADVIYDNKPLVFHEEKTKKLIIDSIMHGIVIIPYEDFTHIHITPGAKELYTIDKSNFTSYARKLLGNTYYPRSRKECILFDMPELLDIEFIFQNSRYLLKGYTDNNQIWIIYFDGIDSENRFIKAKEISVKNK